MTTLCHEVLHTYPRGGRDHGRLFRQRAAQVRALYGYDITRVSERANIARAEPSYEIVCNSCGHAVPRYKRGRIYRNPERYRCAKCGGKLSIREPARPE
jgi:predicted SprT family Zn-dependent metalloprotease